MDLAELRGETAGGHTPFPANDRDSYCTRKAVRFEACFLQLCLALQWWLYYSVIVKQQEIGPFIDICDYDSLSARARSLWGLPLQLVQGARLLPQLSVKSSMPRMRSWPEGRPITNNWLPRN